MPNNLVVLGFDWGSKRIGVAVGSDVLNQANPLKTLSAQGGMPDWNLVKAYIHEWHPHILVVGIPSDMEGKALSTTQRAKKFSDQLHARFQLPVYLVDERLTTVEARQQLFEIGGYSKIQKSQVDSYAANLIVEQWLLDRN